MSYQITHSNTSKAAIVVQDGTVNQETSLTFVGKNYTGYGPVIAENFLYLLENFANESAPLNPTQGQLWYNTAASPQPILNIFNGTAFVPTTHISQGNTAPAVSFAGDLWSDTGQQQLKVYSGSNWIVVGPQFSVGLQTGPLVETITNSATSLDVSIISLYAEDQRIAIISYESFIPKQAINGFSVINQGITLNSDNASNIHAPTKFWGTARYADAFIVNNAIVESINFLRSDVVSTTNNTFNVRTDSGINIGSDLGFNIGSIGNSTVFTSKDVDKNVDFALLNNSSGSNIILHLNANGRIGVGFNNTNPQAVLDISIVNNSSSVGIITNGLVHITNTTNSAGLNNTASLWTAGGLSVAKNSNFGSDATFYGTLKLNSGVTGPVVVPDINNIYDIGSSSNQFRNIYAGNFFGNLAGTFTGTVNGNTSGSAVKLANSSTFRITGDVTTAYDISTNGQTITSNGSPISVVDFITTVSPEFISGKTELTSGQVLNSDFLLVSRAFTGASSLYKVTKADFISSIAAMPIGTILPFAGGTPPPGYLLCDGGEILVSKYTSLFQVIGYIYKIQSALQGPVNTTFCLPDLRGRTILGPDNMNNGSLINQYPVGTNASRVTNSAASSVGSGSGSEYHTISVNNLPDHNHNLKGSLSNQYYAVGTYGSSQDAGAVSNKGLPASGSGAGFGLPNSGGITASPNSQPLSTMNPYLTINYIIFAGY